MKSGHFRTAIALLVVALFTGILPMPVRSEADWIGIYRDYIKSLSNREDDYAGPWFTWDTGFTLVDLDLDGTPELIIGESYRTVNRIYSAVTLRNGQLAQLTATGDGMGEEGGVGMSAFSGELGEYSGIRLYRTKDDERIYIGRDGGGGAVSSSLGDYIITLDGTTIKGEELSTAHFLEDGDYREEHFTFKGQPVSNTEYERLRNQFYAELTEIANAAVYVPVREIYDFDRDFLDEDALIEKLRSFRSPADREAAGDPGEAGVEFENLFPRLTREEQTDIMKFLGHFGTLSRFDANHYESDDILNVIYANTMKLGMGPLSELLRNESGSRWKSMVLPGTDFENLYAEFDQSEVHQYAYDLFGATPDPSSSAYYLDGKYYFPDWGAGGWVEDSPQVANMYRLSDDLYYLEFERYDLMDDMDAIEKYYDYIYVPMAHWGALRDAFFRDYAHAEPSKGYAVVRKVVSDGKRSWRLLKYELKPGLSVRELVNYLERDPVTPNLTIDYRAVLQYGSREQYGSYLAGLLEGLSGEPVNDPGKAELTKYIEYALQRLSRTDVEARDNIVTISGITVQPVIRSLADNAAEFDRILNEHRVSLNKPYARMLLLNAVNLDLGKPVLIRFDETLARHANDVDGIILSLEENRHTVSVSSQDLTGMLGAEPVFVQFHKVADGKYTITFINGANQAVDSISHPLTFEFPAGSEYATVFVNYRNGSDNWGGQYNSNTRTISIAARYSGDYEVIENRVAAGDIAHLPDNQRKAIEFMVSKGFFTVDDDNRFHPDEPIDRNNFTMALVRMFFALDRSLTTTFADVAENDAFHDYIASAQHYRIVKGYDDNTFRGRLNIPVEQLAALASRTLAEKKGYGYPEEPDSYLHFADADHISEWAKNDIALAVREGLLDDGGLLLPRSDATRAQAAEMLYRLFMLLYEIPPALFQVDRDAAVDAATASAAVPEPEAAGTTPDADSAPSRTSRLLPPTVGTGIVLLAAGAGAFLLYRRKSRSHTRQPNE
jgi:hypothetical protein